MTNEEKALYSIENGGDKLLHYGTPRHSGRYPWGSGKNPQRSKDLRIRMKELKDEGHSEKEIALILGYKTTNELRAAKSMAKSAEDRDTYAQIVKLKEKGYSNSEIGRRVGKNESYVRDKLKKGLTSQTTKVDSCVDILTKQMAGENDKFLDLGKGSNLYLGVSKNQMDVALEVMRKKGYEVHTIQVTQLGTSEKTNTKVLAPKGTTARDVYKNLDKILPPQAIGEYVDKDTDKIVKLHAPKSIDSKRILVRYNEEGGVERDGTIELRRDVPDLDLGQSRYAQVRVEVDGSHYLKGMAHYSDNIPEGYDIVFNTNKHVGTPKLDVFKELKDDADPLNRFGALIDRQNDWTDENGKVHEGALNIVRSEGEWGEWSKSVASQMLSKQSPNLARQQLNKDFKSREDEYKEIMSLTNETLKKQLLQEFGDNCDSASVHLKAAAFPRQGYHVLLPVPEMKENEIYAPNYKDGEKVVLIRYPHGGIFEIPELVVNNKVKQAKDTLGEHAQDAVGIHPKVAEQLSGADFDGDTALVIPNNKGDIKVSDPLEGLKGFEPKEIYKKGPDEVPTKGHFDTQREMGMITNLVNDMTIAGAGTDEIVRAVRHSMVVIDAEKHNLDVSTSYQKENIAELKNLYQAKEDPSKPGGGSSTLISRAKSTVHIPERKQVLTVKDPETGEYIVREGIEVATGKKYYESTNRSYQPRKYNEETGKWEDNGPVKKAETVISRMESVDDARELMSGPNHEGYQIERIYADYANKCKALANEARKASLSIKEKRKDPDAAKEYESEVKSIKEKIIKAQMNAPLERLAQRKGNTYIAQLKEADPSLNTREKSDTLKKEKGKALQRARREVGAKKEQLVLTDKEWEAIQAGAVSPTTMREIIANADKDKLKSRALPRESTRIAPATAAKIKQYANKGRTQAEIAEALGISTSEVSKVLNQTSS